MTDGVHAALDQARAAAGDKNVSIGGRARTLQQFLEAGLVEEMQIHVAPVLLGHGVRLFENVGPPLPELEPIRVRESSHATHIRYRVKHQAT